MFYDVHAIVVNMGNDPLTRLLYPGSLVGTLLGSNKLRYYQYNIVDGVDGTVNNLLSQVLLNGNYCKFTSVSKPKWGAIRAPFTAKIRSLRVTEALSKFFNSRNKFLT